MIDHRFVLTVAVAVLLVTAGCIGSIPSDSNSDSTQLTADDVTDTSVLIQAHTETLQTNSFTVHSTATTQDANETFRIRTERTWRVDPEPPIRAWTTSQSTVTGNAPERYEQMPERTSAWRQGNTTTVRVQSGDTARTRNADLLNTSVRLNRALHRQMLLRFSDRQNTTVDEVTRNGTRLHRVQANLNDTHVTSNASMTLFVNPDGYVQRIETTRTIEYRSGPRVVTRTVRFTRVGATTVESPDWANQ
ncbi:hypothetical protein [Halobellus ordinarius]|uniref:hypothetical protein n=1 Tax=Halobellus ordinarius TaxID=3075120 RepID=UPI002880BDA4|nr:hypothetical protein [Halobellus sp. ZY16]